MRLIAILLILGVLTNAGCRSESKAPKEGDVLERAQNPPVAYIVENDPRLREATQQARKALPEFIKTLEGPQNQHTNFAIKTAFHEEGGQPEAIWVTWLRFDGKKFHGTVSNEPVHLKNIFLGSKVSVEADHVVDWLIVDNGKLQGGYTVRVVRDALQGEARKLFEQSLPFAVD